MLFVPHSRRSHVVFPLAAFLAVLATAPGQAQKPAVKAPAGAGPYQIVDHWKIGGAGGWDYLLADGPAHRLYVTHGARVEVLDTQTGKSVGAITGLQGTHGVALDEEGKFGYISDGRANTVVIFDRTTLETVGSVPTGQNPDGIAYEPVTKTVWTFNGRSKDTTVVDTATRTAVATIDLGGKPEFPQADGKGFMYVNNEDKSTIIKLDAATKKIVATWPLTGCESPSGLAIDAAGMRLFAVCDGKKMVVVDATTGKVLGLPSIGDGPDAAGYDAKDNLAFSSNGDGTLTVVDAATLKPVETLTTMKGARTMAYDATMDKVYLVTAEFGARPAATTENPRPRPAVLADSFQVIVVGRK